MNDRDQPLPGRTHKRGARLARRRRLLAGAALGATLLTGVLSPAGADTGGPVFPKHWKPNPYLSVPSSSPFYRSVAVLDNTNNAALSRWIQTMVGVVNNLRNTYNRNYPTLMYSRNVWIGGQPCGSGPNQYLVVCQDANVRLPDVTDRTWNWYDGTDHLRTFVLRFNPKVATWCDGDRFSLVVKEFGMALGLDLNGDPNSALYRDRDPLWGCRYNGFTATDLRRLDQIYNHPL